MEKTTISISKEFRDFLYNFKSRDESYEDCLIMFIRRSNINTNDEELNKFIAKCMEDRS